ncbi:MAG: tetratricopeptide repeat protein [Bacteroidota bacterium]
MLTLAIVLSAWTTVSDLPEAAAAGDDAFFRIDYGRAVECYRGALFGSPDSALLLWRLARAYVCMGEVASPNEQAAMFTSAEQLARQCIVIDSLSSDGHTWLAAALGYRALAAPLDERLSLSWELLREAHRAIALDPENDAAYSILGSFYRALGNVSWLQRSVATVFLGRVPSGGFEESEAALKQAVRLAPGIMRHWYELGVLYIDMGRESEARAALETAAGLPIRTAIDRPRREKARALVESLSHR